MWTLLVSLMTVCQAIFTLWGYETSSEQSHRVSDALHSPGESSHPTCLHFACVPADHSSHHEIVCEEKRLRCRELGLCHPRHLSNVNLGYNVCVCVSTRQMLKRALGESGEPDEVKEEDKQSHHSDSVMECRRPPRRTTGTYTPPLQSRQGPYSYSISDLGSV